MEILQDILAAGRAFDGAQVHLSQWSPVLALSAQANSDRCCYLQRGGHHLWDKRFQELVATGLAKSFGEVNSQSWKRQENCTQVELWTEALRCWKQSKGHWQVASKCWPLFGAGIAKSTQGLWFMTIVVAGSPIPAPFDLPVEPNNPDYKIW